MRRVGNVAVVAIVAILALLITNLASRPPASRELKAAKPRVDRAEYDQYQADVARPLVLPIEQQDESDEIADQEHQPSRPDGSSARLESWLPSERWNPSFSLLLIFVVLLQAAIARRQLNHAHAVERPWFGLVVHRTGAVDAKLNKVGAITDIIKGPLIEKPLLLTAEVVVTNNGHAPGWMAKSYSRLILIDRPLKQHGPPSEAALRKLLEECPALGLAPGQKHGFRESEVLNPKQHRAIKNGEVSLVLFVLLEYREAQNRRFLRVLRRESWFAWDWGYYPNPRSEEHELIPITGPAEPRHWTKYT